MKSPAKHNYKRLFTVLCILDVVWTAVIFSWSLAPAELSTKESSWVLLLIQRVLPSATMHLVRKAAHFTEFMVLGCLLCATVGVYLALRKTRKTGKVQPNTDNTGPETDRASGGSARILLQPCISAGIGLIIAVCDELIQLTSPGRACQISDMLLDFCGTVTGALILLLIFTILRQRKA